ncbi:CorA family divalent cation transporter [Bordetella trematum]|uniref:CorA family divalent cation transporter n=1 Tax=Bordetella trematum TaxID=123899 RepID=UPI000D89887C|nr:CorA family divalent cation transporter [Bordetella trematum]SPU50290.1 Magnesium transport protein CorA [Bordetella trematum]VDH08034.1 Magnesium transport protein CorA [Bordetella trematum]
MNAIKELPAWQRLHAGDLQALEDLGRLHDVDLVPRAAAGGAATLRIRCTRLKAGKLVVSDLLWREADDGGSLYTVETGYPLLRPGEALERLQAQSMAVDCPQSIALVLLHQLLSQTVRVLERINQDLSSPLQAIRAFQLNVGTNNTRGVEDLSSVDTHLNSLNAPLSYVLQSLDDIEQATQRLRRSAPARGESALARVQELMTEIEGVQRRARFMLERQRFHWRAAGETVAMSDLNVTKVFSVLWAAFIPGTALINWYGQNFRVMPELSWDGSLWVQLVAVLVLTAVPVWMVKQSGALR